MDFFVANNMGVEFLIRASDNNELTARQLLGGAATKTALIEHAARADETAARHFNQASYASVARNCSKGYATVLFATLTRTDALEEWQSFKEVINKMNSSDQSKGMLDYHIMVAVARFGWASFDVFLHQPGQQAPIRFEVPRQRLMLKVVDGQPQSARHFYPRPEKVWVQRLAWHSGRFQPTGRAVPVPAGGTVGHLQLEIKTLSTQEIDVFSLEIYRLNHTGEWELTTEDQVLYGNTREKPYGFYVSE